MNKKAKILKLLNEICSLELMYEEDKETRENAYDKITELIEKGVK